MSQSKISEQQPELEWIQMKKDFDSQRLSEEEGGIAKFKRKFMENPMVPLGKKNELFISCKNKLF